MRTKLALVIVTIALALPSAAAVHHSKRQNAYSEQHEKCRAALKAAQAEARKHQGEERKQIEKAAREAYDRCEEYAHLVWKYYPEKPPVPDPTAPQPKP